MLISLVTNLVLNYVFSGQTLPYNQLVRSLQLVLHLPILKIPFPPSVIMVFNHLIPVIMFDIFEYFEPFQKLLSFDDQKLSSLADEKIYD